MKRWWYVFWAAAIGVFIVFWGAFFHYNYVTHLIWESAIVFSYVSAFIFLSLLPKKRRECWLYYLGFVFLAVAILEHVHSMVYPGYYTMDPSKAVLYWMYARGTFTFGVLTSLILNRIRASKKLVKRMSVALFISVGILIALSFYGFEELFYNGSKTTYLKALLETIYAMVLFITAMVLKGEFTLSAGLVLSGIGELWFLNYGGNVFTFQFVAGHAFILVGSFLILLWVSVRHVFHPFRETEILAEKYGSKLVNVSRAVERSKTMFAHMFDLLLKAENLDDLRRAIGELKDFVKLDESGYLVLFYEENLIFKSDETLPGDEGYYSAWERFREGPFRVYYRGISEDHKEQLKALLGWINVKRDELELEKGFAGYRMNSGAKTNSEGSS